LPASKPSSAPRGRHWAGLCLAIVLLVGCRRDAAPRPENHSGRNVLLVVVDTLRFDAGGPDESRPDVAVPESLRSRGRHFLRTLSAGIQTKPSMMALLTGFYPSESGLLVNGAKVLKPAGPMLAERLRTAGFATAAVVSNPNLVGQGLGFDRGFDTFDARMTGQEPNRPTGTRTAVETTNAALEQLAVLSRIGKPWFLWVHYLEPHGPYRPPSPFLDVPADPGAPLPVAEGDFAAKGTIPRYQFLPVCRGRNDYTARYRGYARFSLSEADRLLKAVYASPSMRNTVVIFTSDHGEFLGEQDYWFQHGMRIDPVLFHVPLVVVRSPDDPRSEDGRFVGHVDLVGTLLRLLGLGAAATRGEDLFEPPLERRQPLLVENLALPETLEMGVLQQDGVVVESNREPEVEFVAGNSALWAARRPAAAAVRHTTDVLRPLIARILNTPSETFRMTPEQIRTLRSLGYVGGS
jgi:arylsulfatase A-like enzyme